MPAVIIRDPRFSMSLVDYEVPTYVSRSSSPSFGRQIERRVVRAWKFVTRTTRKQPRNSFIAPDFVVLTSRKRNSIHPQLYRYQNY
ncbi:hypothetical protein D9619_006469 [Psilocybe cf. subviscida]|uniref:Uncharacterized protein n=1 Tax=Psilocybe cf. subviscida TaxID=2480587 RepID=A0A8H5B6E5_9AGAR|nr:hypothetical protein D9619_006469 [Psilocybe cf. subviscida]